jgi:hypothetical protein
VGVAVSVGGVGVSEGVGVNGTAMTGCAGGAIDTITGVAVATICPLSSTDCKEIA